MCENNVKILTTGCYSEVCKYLNNCEKTCQKYHGCYTVSLLNRKLENMESVCSNPEYSSTVNFLKEELGEYYFNEFEKPTVEDSYELSNSNNILSIILEAYPLTIYIQEGTGDNLYNIYAENSDNSNSLEYVNIPSQDLILILNSFNISINPESLEVINTTFKPSTHNKISNTPEELSYFLQYLETNNIIKFQQESFENLEKSLSAYNSISTAPEILVK